MYLLWVVVFVILSPVTNFRHRPLFLCFAHGVAHTSSTSILSTACVPSPPVTLNVTAFSPMRSDTASRTMNPMSKASVIIRCRAISSAFLRCSSTLLPDMASIGYMPIGSRLCSPIVRRMANAFMLFSSLCHDDFMKRKLRLFYMLPLTCKVFGDFFTRFAPMAYRWRCSHTSRQGCRYAKHKK